MSIGENIKQIRKSKNMTQRELGEKIGGISQQQIGQWENNIKNPKIETVVKIADALNVPVSALDKELADILHANNAVTTLSAIYQSWGYEIYTLCDTYLSISEKYKEELLDFAIFLLKRDRGKDFEPISEKEVSELFSADKINKYIL